jgi:hypothetical protein
VGARNQARWLPAHRPARWRPRPPVHPSGSRLDRPGTRDRRGDPFATGQLGDDRWRGRRVRLGRHLGLRPPAWGTGPPGLAKPLPLCVRYPGAGWLRSPPRPMGNPPGCPGAGAGRLSVHLDGDGPAMFRAACAMGLEGIVSKRRDRPYRSGRSPDWIKVKSPDAPAATRILER